MKSLTKEQIEILIGLITGLIEKLRQLLAMKKGKETIEQMIRRVCKEEGMDKYDENVIIAVIKCESGMNPKAIGRNSNGTIDYGLCQYNSYWYIQRMKLITKNEALNDPEKCVRLMCQRFRKGRRTDWVCYGSKKYLKYY